MAYTGTRLPSNTPPIDPRTNFFDWRWLRWFTGLATSITNAATQVSGGKVSLSDQHASISTTAIPTTTLAAGLYRVNVYQRITTADGVSSSLQTTISWTDGGVSCQRALTALTGDTTATVGTDPPVFIHVDGSTPISYATVYASNTANKMRYALRLQVEVVSLDA